MNWKGIAIFCMILLVFESAFLYWAYDIGTSEINNENECAINICKSSLYDSYYYYEGICGCYSEGVLMKEVFINDK